MPVSADIAEKHWLKIFSWNFAKRLLKSFFKSATKLNKKLGTTYAYFLNSAESFFNIKINLKKVRIFVTNEENWMAEISKTVFKACLQNNETTTTLESFSLAC